MKYDSQALGRAGQLVRTLIGSAGLASSMFAASAIAAPTLSVTHSATPGSVQVFVRAADVVDLYAYQFTLTFDPSILSVNSVTEGSLLGSGGTTFFDAGTINNVAGNVSAVLGTLVGPVAGVSGTGVLASFSFNVLQNGTASVGLADAWALDSSVADMTVTLQGATILAAVPEPESWMMLMLGLGALAAVRHRGRRA